MDFIFDFLLRFISQFQTASLGFLIGGIALAALGSRLTIPNPIYQFIVFMLLIKIGLKGGIEIRHAALSDILLPALFAALIGVIVVLVGRAFFSLIPSIKQEDGIATAGLFGAVSASTLAAAMVLLETESIAFEAWVPALYPFMDIPALVLAIVLANIYLTKKKEGKDASVDVWFIIKDSLQGSALSALLLGLALGFFTRPETVFVSFYEPLFRGFLSILMLVMGMEAYSRIDELKKVAHWFAVYAFFAPILHGLLAFGLGYIAHLAVGLSPGGVIMLAILAASNSDVSGPPTLRGGIPSANPSTYIGASTSVGTPVAIAICIPLFIALSQIVFN